MLFRKNRWITPLWLKWSVSLAGVRQREKENEKAVPKCFSWNGLKNARKSILSYDNLPQSIFFPSFRLKNKLNKQTNQFLPQSSFGIIQDAILILEKFKGQMNGSAAHDSFTTVDSVIFSLRFQFLLIVDADYKLNKL